MALAEKITSGSRAYLNFITISLFNKYFLVETRIVMI